LGVTITWVISCGLESSKLQLQLFQAANNWPLFPPALLLTPLLQGRPGFGYSPNKLPLFTESPSRREGSFSETHGVVSIVAPENSKASIRPSPRKWWRSNL